MISNWSRSLRLLVRCALLSSAVCLLYPAVRAEAQVPAVDAPAGVLEEVVVTARKRTEVLQRTPAAITAMTGESLVAFGIADIRAAQNFVPSVRFQPENASTEIYIRGVGSTLDLPNIDPPTSFNFNGIYIPREATSVGLFDIAQLEVLPGPQGTLYGRSSLGGTVNVTFNRPDLEALATDVLFETGSDSLYRGTIVQNLPVTEEFAVRGAVDYIHHDGYLATGADSKDDWSARLSALYEPSDDLTVHVWTHGAKKHGRSPNLVRRGFNGGTFDGDPTAFESSDPWNDVITDTEPDAGRQDYENLVIGGQLDWTFGDDTTLTYIPGYVYLDWVGNYWLENLPSLLSAHYNQLTNELRLAGTAAERWEWLVGAYAYRMTNDGQFIVNGFTLADINRNRLEGVAAFGEVTYQATDRLRLTVGGRYSDDEREGSGATAFGEPYTAEQSFDRFDWKLGATYDVADAAMLYATVQTAYQPGTYNLFPSSTDENLVKSAKLTAYSIGIKSRVLDDHLQINNEVFYYDYRDLFVQSFNLNTALLTTFNAEEVEIYGNQLDVLWQITENDRLNLAVGYLHARNKEFIVPPGINIGTDRRDFGGYALQYAPDWTVSAGYQRDFHLPRGYLRARVDSRYESAFWGTFSHARGTQQKSYIKSDASLTYHAASGAWSLGVWVRNIENEAVLAATTTGQFGPYADVFLEPPRTYGVRLELQF
ncbi:MAG TPA: TonB-dependent receptor [Steroidobacteraceae bacterium]|nr:TonB-dependent receptor [Steroidobacteraceae bacterium]